MKSQQNCIMKHLNWTYGFALLIGIAILIYVGFIQNSAIGYIVYISVAIAGGFLVLWAKKRLPWGMGSSGVSWLYPVLVFTSGLGFPIAVLCLKNKRETKLSETQKAQSNVEPR